MSFKLFGNNFGQESLGYFYDLFNNQERDRNPFFPDFVVYIVDDEFDMAYHESNIEEETDLPEFADFVFTKIKMRYYNNDKVPTIH